MSYKLTIKYFYFFILLLRVASNILCVYVCSLIFYDENTENDSLYSFCLMEHFKRFSCFSWVMVLCHWVWFVSFDYGVCQLGMSCVIPC